MQIITVRDLRARLSHLPDHAIIINLSSRGGNDSYIDFSTVYTFVATVGSVEELLAEEFEGDRYIAKDSPFLQTLDPKATVLFIGNKSDINRARDLYQHSVAGLI